MDGPGMRSRDVSGTAAKDTISIGSGDRVSGADRMGMEVHADLQGNAEIMNVYELYIPRHSMPESEN